jgi:hypothetical protein
LNEQALALAKQVGDKFKINKLESEQIRLLQDKQIINASHASFQKSLQAQARKEVFQLKSAQAELNESFEERNEILKSGDLDSDNKTIAANAQKRLNALNETIEKGLKRVSESKTLKELGKTAEFKELANNLDTAFKSARFDFDREIARLNAKLKTDIIPFRIAIDPTGLQEAGFQKLGLEDVVGESQAERARRTLDFAKQIQKVESETATDIAKSENRRLASLGSALNITVGMGKLLTDLEISTAAAKQAAKESALAATGDPFGVPSSDAAAQEKKNTQAIKASLTARNDLTASLLFAIRLGKSRLVIEDATFASIKKRIELMRANRTLSTDDAKALGFAAKSLETSNLLLKEQNKIRELGPTEEQVTGSEMVLDNMEAQAKLLGNSATLQKDVRESIARATADQHKAETALANQNTELTGISTKTGEAADNTGDVESNSKGALAAANALSLVWTKIAISAASAASSAAQASGGGSSKFLGGPAQYLAAGGPARGADTINTKLARGETVVDKRNSARFSSQLNAMNQGSQPVYREQGGPVTNVGDVNVTVNGGDSSQQTVREIGNQLRREIHRGTIKLS